VPSRRTARSPISAGFVALGLATFRQRDLQFPRDDPIPPLSARRLQGVQCDHAAGQWRMVPLVVVALAPVG
jgi:hypothetical protein